MSLARNFERNRGFGQGTGKGATITHAEDSQPNESIDKRRAVPSLVVPSRPPQRAGDLKWGFRGQGRGRGRGGYTPNRFTHNQPIPYNSTGAQFSGPAGRSSGSVNPASGRVPAVITDASRGLPLHSVAQQPKPYLEQSMRVSDLARIPPAPIPASMPASTSTSSVPSIPVSINLARAPPFTKARPRPPTTHTSVSPAQTTPPTASRIPDSPPPPKRRRIEPVVDPVVKIEEPPAVLTPRAPSPPAFRSSPPSTPPIRIKLEARSPSPPPADPPRRSATSGTKRYFPVPNDCNRAFTPEFAVNRRKWARREGLVLRDLGLKVEKYFFRDDGMVLEWISEEPVWLDTLRPVQERPRLPVPTGQEIIDVDIDTDTEPPHPSVVIPPSSPARPTSPIPGPSGAASPLLPVDDDVTPAPEVEEEQPALTVEEEQEQLQQLSLDFIKRYILTFDRDRDALAAAYAEDAIVSFRDNNFACPTHFTFQRTRVGSQSKSTMPKLPALQNFRFSPRTGTIDLDYDSVVLEGELDAPTKVMLSVNGELFGINDERRLAIDQTFVLRRNVGNVSGVGKSDDAWPLVATSHLMVVRDTPWLRWTGTLDGLG